MIYLRYRGRFSGEGDIGFGFDALPDFLFFDCEFFFVVVVVANYEKKKIFFF
jgi:hypothetical protein